MNPELAARDVAERIRAGRNFLITSHRNPDGDALGSGLALQRLIRQLGKRARMQVRDGFNAALRNIPGANEVTITDDLPRDYPNAYDGVFTMECPEVERTGYPVLPGPVVNIDHHLGNTMYGEINYLDLDAPSVGEMVLQINRNHLKLPLDPETATAMYVSLATDTGFFRYHNTTLRAFEAAEELVRAGVVPGCSPSSSIGSGSSASTVITRPRSGSRRGWGRCFPRYVFGRTKRRSRFVTSPISSASKSPSSGSASGHIIIPPPRKRPLATTTSIILPLRISSSTVTRISPVCQRANTASVAQ